MQNNERFNVLLEALQDISDAGLVDLAQCFGGQGINSDELEDLYNYNDKELTSIDAVNLGVKVIDQDNELSVVEASEADFEVCPVCGSDNINFGDCEPDGVFVYRVHTCFKCECNWEERYDLVRVIVEGNIQKECESYNNNESEDEYHCTKCERWFADEDVETFSPCVCKVCAQDGEV